MAVERSAQVIGAFVALIGERGLEAVTLDDVARAAGVDRTVIRHYVGNRQDLIWAAVDHLAVRYERASRDALGDDPSLDRWLALLFGGGWGTAVDDAAFDVLIQEAIRDDALRERMRAGYAVLVDAVADAVRGVAPQASRRATVDVAYSIVCLAEQNLTMQALGFPHARATAARRAARALADALPNEGRP